MSVSGLFTRIYHDLVNDRISLVRLPDVVIRLRRAMARRDLDIDTLARVIQTDVGATAYLLSIANSAAYRTRVRASDVQAAIRMMGIPAFNRLVTVYAVRSMVDCKHAPTLAFLKSHWHRSANRAAIACAIAKQTPGVDADKAMLAGLLQDVGALPILMQLQGAKSSTADAPETGAAAEVELALRAYTGKVSNLLARKWELDPDLQAVIRNADNLAYDGGAETDLVDVVNIAQLLSRVRDRDSKWPRLEDCPCLRKFGESGLTLETSLSLLQQAREDINEVRQALSA